MTKVMDATTVDGSTPWFMIFENGYDPNTGNWGNDIINEGCGKQQLKIPADIANGDYLLRAETIALHAAGQPGGAQFYMSCYVSSQLTTRYPLPVAHCPKREMRRRRMLTIDGKSDMASSTNSKSPSQEGAPPIRRASSSQVSIALAIPGS